MASKKTSTKKAPKAKTTKKTKAAAAPVAVATTPASECPRGGDHEWADADEGRHCTKCLEPAPSKGKRGKAKAAKALTAEKPPRAKKAKADAGEKKLSAIDAAARVLGEAKQPMNCKELIESMSTKGYWTSPGGKTPHATLYSAILREITAKGKEARFAKTERGKFAIAN